MPNTRTSRTHTHRPRLPMLRTPTKRHRTPHKLGKQRSRPHRMTSPAKPLAALLRACAGGPCPHLDSNRTSGTATACARNERSPGSPRARSRRLLASPRTGITRLMATPRTGEANVRHGYRARERGTLQCLTATAKNEQRPQAPSHSPTSAITAGSEKTNKAARAHACVAGRTSPTPPRFTASADRSAQARASARSDRSAPACAHARGATR